MTVPCKSSCISYFNPRTHKECDLTPLLYAIRVMHFNPRTHKECDILDAIKSWPHVSISIHALTRSATCFSVGYFSVAIDFNPRTHKECDLYLVCIVHAGTLFQSTHSQGVRPPFHAVFTSKAVFQSTHSQGVRPSSKVLTSSSTSISIHALTRSATLL